VKRLDWMAGREGIGWVGMCGREGMGWHGT
jgi:hypothetical protein